MTDQFPSRGRRPQGSPHEKPQGGQGDGFIPIPEANRDALLKGGGVNFSLAFPRLMRWEIEGSELKKPNASIEDLFKIAEETVYPLKGELEKIHCRQEKILDNMERSGFVSITLYAELTAPFISGLGSGHPNETGMILDRNTGCPFLPASSIKGVLRTAYALNLAETDPSNVTHGNLRDELLRKYFGDVDAEALKIQYSIPRSGRTRGQIVFLDAYPLDPPKLKLDIMNPHYGKYYDQKEGAKKFSAPVETEPPVPIKFIALEKGSVFVFRCFFLPLVSDEKNDNRFSDDDKKAVQVMFDTAFTRLGFGGKTAVGYGRFKTLTAEDAKKAGNRTPHEAPLAELKPGDVHTAILKEIKKNRWRVVLQSNSEINGVILNTTAVPSDRKIGDHIKVVVKAKSSSFMYNFDYTD